ncbi:MAG: ZIP family metal transporter [Clostridia bacterium]|nr:ZIP family metal transporter [Clostridia bacterium]
MSAKILSIVLLSIGGSTVAGVLAGLLFRHIPHRLNDIVLGFAAGVMLAASILGLIAPAFETQDGILLAICGTFAGAGLISILDRIVPHLHRIAGIDTEAHRSNGSIGKTLLFVTAIALHKIPEGLATGVSFGTGDVGDIITVAGSMSLQNIPEAIVIVAPLFAIGVAAGRVVCISFAIAAISIVSVLAGCALTAIFAGAMPFILTAAGGAMLYVISDEMIPETHSHGYEKPATFALISGLLLVIIQQRLLAPAS